MDISQAYAPRIYYLHPLLIGALPDWPAFFDHAAALGFDHVLIASPFLPGRTADVQIVADHGRVHPVFCTEAQAATVLGELVEEARQRGLALLIDAAIDRVAADGRLVAEHPDWFEPFDVDAVRLDPRRPRREQNVAVANFANPDAIVELTEWWSGQLLEWGADGVAGFRFDAPNRVPAHIWRRLAGAVRERLPDMRFLAWTPGIARPELNGLVDAAFDAVFTSLRWWDYRAAWYAAEHAALLRIASPITFPESPFGWRLSNDLPRAGRATVERLYQRALCASAGLGTGWLVPHRASNMA